MESTTGGLRVFRLEFDEASYQSLYLDYPDDAPEWDLLERFDAGPLKHQWVTPRAYVLEPRLPEPDFWSLHGEPVLGFEESTLQLVRAEVEGAGELLDIDVEGRSMWLLNVLRVYNCLDTRASTIDELLGVVRYVFHPHRLAEAGLFKIPETDFLEILLLESDDTSSLRRVVEAEGLRGVSFRLLWSAMDGPEDIPRLHLPGVS
jgi:hypothetical protein